MVYTPETLRDLANAQNKFVWEIHEFEQHDRSPKWYLIVSILALISVIYGIFSNNYLLALLILIAATILILGGNQSPRKILIQIGNNGIVIDGKLMEYDKFFDFAIIYHPPFSKVLYLERKMAIQPRIRLLLEDQDPLAIRQHLLQYVPENLALRDEHLSDILGRLLKI